jgi:hypothetical protein
MLTHKTTLADYKIGRSIFSESFNNLSSAVSKIIRGQNSFFKEKIPLYFPTGTDILNMQKFELSS